MMKQLLTAGAFMLCALAGKTQQANTLTASQFQRDFVSVKVIEPGSHFPLSVSGTLNYNKEKYRKFKKMRTTGIILTSVGAGLITSGIVLLSTTDDDGDGYYEYGDYYVEGDDGKIVGGAVCLVMGILSTGGGITMWTIGNRKMKQYGSANLSLKSTKSGLGFAYTF
ncbi:MAG: hypothetical protein QM640_08055 [Niabella sp.]